MKIVERGEQVVSITEQENTTFEELKVYEEVIVPADELATNENEIKE